MTPILLPALVAGYDPVHVGVVISSSSPSAATRRRSASSCTPSAASSKSRPAPSTRASIPYFVALLLFLVLLVAVSTAIARTCPASSCRNGPTLADVRPGTPRTVMESAISSALSKEPGGSLRSSTLGPAASKVYLGIRAQIISLELSTLRHPRPRSKIAEDLRRQPVPGARGAPTVGAGRPRAVLSAVAHHRRQDRRRARARDTSSCASPSKLRSDAQPGEGPPVRTGWRRRRRILAMQKLVGDDLDIGEFMALDKHFHAVDVRGRRACRRSTT